MKTPQKQKCSKCKLSKPLTQFRYDKRRGNHRKDCRACENAQKRNITPQQYYVFDFLKSHKCASCGERNPICLEFHHLKPSTKTSDIATLVKTRVSILKIKTEIDKCVVLCANCHRYETARHTKNYKFRLMYDSNYQNSYRKVTGLT